MVVGSGKRAGMSSHTKVKKSSDRRAVSLAEHLSAVRRAVRRASRRTQRRAEMMSVVVAVSFVGIVLLNFAASAEVVSLSEPDLEFRTLGDPDVARERIVTENFTTLQDLNDLARDPSLTETERLVYEHAPLILWYGTEFPAQYSTPIGLYYQVSQSVTPNATATTIRYFLWFSDEEGGMAIENRLAMFGHSLDRELVYRVTLLEEDVVGAYFQAPGHRLLTVNDPGDSRPVFTIASANHNFRQVTGRELDFPGEKLLLAPLPQLESPWNPAHDPDYAALAVAEVWEKYGINVSNYVFVELEMPTVPTAATISVRIDDRWYYLHEQIGGGISRPGYNQVAIEIGYPVLPGDVDELRIVAYTSTEWNFEPIRVTAYPRTGVSA